MKADSATAADVRLDVGIHFTLLVAVRCVAESYNPVAGAAGGSRCLLANR